MEKMELRIEGTTRRWWFYCVLATVFFLPAYSEVPFDSRETPEVVTEVLSHSVIVGMPLIWPAFKALPVLFLVLLLIGGRWVTRLFYGYIGIMILGFAVLQNAAMTPSYGLAVISGNLVVQLLVAGMWFWQAKTAKMALSLRGQPVLRYWVVPVAFLAYWFPVNLESRLAEFSLGQLLTNSSGLAFCMMVPVYLAVLTISVREVSPPALRITGFVALVTAFFNLVQWFVLAPFALMGILHLPLLVTSLYAFLLGFRGNGIRPLVGQNGTAHI